MANNPFLKPSDSYQRQINPIRQYIDQMAHYLSISTGDPIEQCRTYVQSRLTPDQLPSIRDPLVRHYYRDDNGDNTVQETPLSRYIQNVTQNDYILVPSFTVYLSPKQKPSILVRFTEKNKKLRSIAKKKAHHAKAEGNLLEYDYQNNVQNKKKIYNNAMSGGFGAEGTILYNPSAHSTLTSVTRSVVSLCNATNEKMLAGNRHYWSPDIALNDLIAVTTYTDYAALNAVMVHYGLHYPTAEETLRVVQYSTDLYWQDGIYLQPIHEFIQRLTPIQRASFVYTGDFYHLRVFNPEVIRTLLHTLSQRITTPQPDALAILPTLNEDIVLLTHQLCTDLVRGYGRNYEKMAEAGLLDTLLSTALHVESTINRYKDLINVFFLTDNVPASIAQIPHMLRRVVPLSDTDSSCFATDKWVEWYRGTLVNDPESLAIAGAVAYLTTQCMAHTLATFSANINTPVQYMHTLAVKGEFIWDVFLATNKAKHYAARPIYQEGNVFATPEYEIKGVHLISSASPSSVIQDLHGLIKRTLDRIAAGEYVSMLSLLTHVADLERAITQSLLSGQEEFCRTTMIKDAAGYVLDKDKSPYQYYTLWQDVFAPKYGEIPPPPYTAIKIPTTLENKTAVKLWLQSMPDQAFAHRMMEWMLRVRRTEIGVFQIPKDHVLSNGIPTELKSIMDTKRIVLELTNGYRLILQSLGFYCKKNWLISEYGY
ncbi:MAG: family B DNA polymerase [Methylococcaceae bacterium]